MTSSPEIDPSVYEPTKPEIPTKYDVQSSECKFAAKQENIPTAHIDHGENQQEQGETMPDYQQAQSQIQSQQSHTPSEAKDKQRQPTVELSVSPLQNMTGPAGDNNEPEPLFTSFQSKQMYSNGPSEASNRTPKMVVPFMGKVDLRGMGEAQSSVSFNKASKRLKAISFQNNPMYSNVPSQQTIQSTPVSVPSASADPKKGKTASLRGRFKKCFS
ncbi:hypothetical protein OWV82_015237 [Melia azedarach]|uniref:Uncharacterized protein n=1 Tax=Melia azedarach TaxID=155640 RepID=A0ACC1XQ97_MELAZ|nr:hypothetical protein OWV82_015237 [Melia azedarach]